MKSFSNAILRYTLLTSALVLSPPVRKTVAPSAARVCEEGAEGRAACPPRLGSRGARASGGAFVVRCAGRASPRLARARNLCCRGLREPYGTPDLFSFRKAPHSYAG